MRKTDKKASQIDSAQSGKILAPQQFRLCMILSEKREADTSEVAKVYAARKGEEENYVKTYSQLLKLLKNNIVRRREAEKAVPPYNAVRRVLLWSMTALGSAVLAESKIRYQVELERLRVELMRSR